jgi:hypothetical protein
MERHSLLLSWEKSAERERERERERDREIREREEKEKEREIPTSTEVNSTILCGCLPMGFETKQQAEPSG